MAKLPSTEKVINTYRHMTIYYRGLETAAANFEKDKGHSALAAVGLTVRFLMRLKVHESLLAPLMEAGQIIEREMNARTAKQQRAERDVWDSVVVSLLNAEGVKLEDAAKKIHERDPVEASRLLVFRNHIGKGKTKGAAEARNLYHLLKRDFIARFPKNTGAKALRASKAMRGKKGQIAG
jgi:hypothetical protein